MCQAVLITGHDTSARDSPSRAGGLVRIISHCTVRWCASAFSAVRILLTVRVDLLDIAAVAMRTSPHAAAAARDRPPPPLARVEGAGDPLPPASVAPRE